MSKSYTISPLAYLKIILHAAKYADSTIVGILIGSLSQESTSNANGDVVIQDVIPLLHHWTSLSCMMEAGLQLADLHCASRGLSFLGIYIANERLDDVSIPRALRIVADQMKRGAAETIVIVVDNNKLASGESALIPFASTSPSSWTPFSAPSLLALSDGDIPLAALSQVRKGRCQTIADFDEHLEDVTRDWLENKSVSLR